MTAAWALAPLLVVAAVPTWAQSSGSALYMQHCATCHQADGSGTVGLAPPNKGEHWARLHGDRSYLANVMLWGLSGPIKVGSTTFVGAMPGLASQLDDAALAAIANHVLTLQGAAETKPYSADEFKALRERPATPVQTRQQRVKLNGG